MSNGVLPHWGRAMGSLAKPELVREYFETGTEPEFFVTEIRLEDAGAGNVRVFAYNLKHQRDAHLLFTVIVPIQDIIKMGRQAMDAGTGAFNALMLSPDQTRQ